MPSWVSCSIILSRIYSTQKLNSYSHLLGTLDIQPLLQPYPLSFLFCQAAILSGPFLLFLKSLLLLEYPKKERTPLVFPLLFMIINPGPLPNPRLISLIFLVAPLPDLTLSPPPFPLPFRLALLSNQDYSPPYSYSIRLCSWSRLYPFPDAH